MKYTMPPSEQDQNRPTRYVHPRVIDYLWKVLTHNIDQLPDDQTDPKYPWPGIERTQIKERDDQAVEEVEMHTTTPLRDTGISLRIHGSWKPGDNTRDVRPSYLSLEWEYLEGKHDWYQKTFDDWPATEVEIRGKKVVINPSGEYLNQALVGDPNKPEDGYATGALPNDTLGERFSDAAWRVEANEAAFIPSEVTTVVSGLERVVGYPRFWQSPEGHGLDQNRTKLSSTQPFPETTTE